MWLTKESKHFALVVEMRMIYICFLNFFKLLNMLANVDVNEDTPMKQKDGADLLPTKIDYF